MVCGLWPLIRVKDIELVDVLLELFGIETGNVPYSLPLSLSTLLHLVLPVISIISEMSHISDIHHMLDLISVELESSLEDVVEDVCPEISEMGVVVHGWSATIESYFIILQWLEFFLFSCPCVV